MRQIRMQSKWKLSKHTSGPASSYWLPPTRLSSGCDVHIGLNAGWELAFWFIWSLLCLYELSVARMFLLCRACVPSSTNFHPDNTTTFHICLELEVEVWMICLLSYAFISASHWVAEWLKLEGTSGCHLVAALEMRKCHLIENALIAELEIAFYTTMKPSGRLSEHWAVSHSL